MHRKNIHPLLGIAFGLMVVSGSAADLTLRNAQAQVYFSPHGGCTEAIVEAINKAHRSILVQAYSFTSMPIAASLKAAHDRGVDVRVILDKSQRTERYSDLAFIRSAGIPVAIDAAYSIAHSKTIVIDEETVITGSFNFTKAAEAHNAENLLIIMNADLATLYTKNWQTNFAISEKD